MKFTHLSPLLVLLPTALCCNHEALATRAQTNQTVPLRLIPGNDPPADPATQSYFINHIALLVSDLNRTREWYSTVLGMRHIFTMELSPEYALMYMGHSQAGRNGMGYQTGAEMARDKNNMAGLVEFQYYSGQKERKYEALNPRNTFSHLGLIVDDVKAAQERFDGLGVRIVKRYDELDVSGATEESRVVAGGWGFSNIGTKEGKVDLGKVVPALEVMGFKQFFIAADPDGNMFEVQAFVPSVV